MIVNVLLLLCFILTLLSLIKEYYEPYIRICKYDILDECYEYPLKIWFINHPFVEVIECND